MPLDIACIDSLVSNALQIAQKNNDVNNIDSIHDINEINKTPIALRKSYGNKLKNNTAYLPNNSFASFCEFSNLVKEICTPEEYHTFNFEIVNKMLRANMTIGDRYIKLSTLIKLGLNINAYCYNETCYGFTPLHVTVMMGDISGYTLLVKLNARLDLQTLEENHTLLDLAIMYNTSHMLRIILYNYVNIIDRQYIIKCVLSEAPRYFYEIFLDYGVDINELDHDGKNALYYAKMKDDDKLKKYLVSKGAIKIKENTKDYITRKLKDFRFILLSVPF